MSSLSRVYAMFDCIRSASAITTSVSPPLGTLRDAAAGSDRGGMAKHNNPGAQTAKGGKSNLSSFQPANEFRRRQGRREKHKFVRDEQTKVGHSRLAEEPSLHLPVVGFLVVAGFFLVLYGALFYTLDRAKREGDAHKPR